MLGESFRDESLDKNGDQIISYREWRDGLRLKACRDPEFIPRTLAEKVAEYKRPDEGIDPQFSEYLMPAELPLVLTKKGVELWQSGQMVISTKEDSPLIWDHATEEICKEEEKYIQDIYSLSTSDLMSKLDDETGPHRTKILFHLSGRSPTELKQFEGKFLQLLRQENDQNNQLYLVKAASRIKKNAEIKAEMLKIFENTSYIILRQTAFQGVAESCQKEDGPFLLKHLQDQDNTIRGSALDGLASIQYKEAYPFVFDLLEHDKDEMVRMNAASCLAAIDLAKASEVFWSKIHSEPSDFAFFAMVQTLLFSPQKMDLVPIMRERLTRLKTEFLKEFLEGFIEDLENQ